MRKLALPLMDINNIIAVSSGLRPSHFRPGGSQPCTSQMQNRYKVAPWLLPVS